MTQVVVSQSGTTQAIVSGSSSQTFVSGASSFSVTTSKVLNTVVVQQPVSSALTINETSTSVVVTKPEGRIVQIATAGPQGPPFAGAQYFDTTAIGALTSGDNGTLLAWSGSVFVPVKELSTNLTIAGGAF